MPTIREWLNDEGFDFEEGTIVVSDNPGDRFRVVENDDPILDKLFFAYGSCPECAKFIASDKTKVYFPRKHYDGVTRINYVYRDVSKYLDK